MERYYEGQKRSDKKNNTPNRSDVNQTLYEEVIDLNDGHDTLSGAIDISRIKDLVEAREAKSQPNDYKSLLNLDEIRETPDLSYQESELDKTFDINKVLKKAKEEIDTTEVASEPRKLNNTNFDILKNIDVKEPLSTTPKEPVEEIKELFNTITMEALSLEKQANDLALDVLTDLKPEETDTNVTAPIETTPVEELPTKEMILEEPTDETNAFNFTMENAKPLNQIVADRSELADNNLEKTINEFYTGNIEFDPKDFEDLESGTRSNKLIWFLVILLLLVIGATAYYIYLNFM